jgi:PAS domain S-box-containing protein
MNNAKVLLVEDEQIISMEIAHRLKRSGYDVVGTATSGWEAYEKAVSLRPDVIIMDINLSGDLDGIKTTEAIRSKVDIPVIYLTAFGDHTTVSRAKHTEPYGYLVKPFETRELESTIVVALNRRKMEAKLKESERWLNATLRSIGDAILATNSDGIIKYSNKQAEQILGLDSDTLKGKRIDHVFHLVDPQTYNPIENPVITILNNPYPQKNYNEAFLLKRNAELMMIEEHTTLIRDEAGTLTGVVLIFRDITERKQSELGLIASETKYRNLFESMSQGVLYNDINGDILSFNSAVCKIFDIKEEELSQINIFDSRFKFFFEDGTELPLEKLPPYVALKTGKEVKDILLRIRFSKTGDEKWLTLSSTPEYSAGNSKPFRIFTIISDITHIKNYEAELKELNKSKDDFFSIIAHDLKSPFQGLLGFTGLLKDEFPNLSEEEKNDFIDRIHSTTRNIFQFIEQLLEWSRLQTGRVEYRKEKIDIEKVVNTISQLHKPNADNKHISIENRIAAETFGYGDIRMFEAVIDNLLSNAIKFTPDKGIIKISADILDQFLQVTVEDSGVGIAQNKISKLFKIDSHISTKGTSGETGTGLGLILCAEIVNKLQGKIWVESIEGNGTKFIFTIPKYQ